jgi:translation initiation factor IF-3
VPKIELHKFNYRRRVIIARPRQDAPPASDGPRINEAIRAASVRCIDSEGEQLGILSLDEALRKADEAGLDLVELQPNAVPPVCKILDYGKYKYQSQKRASEARKKQKIIEVKEIKLRPNIDTHDYNVKLRAAQKFLEAGDKVKVTLRFRGREMSYQDIGRRILQRFLNDLHNVAKAEHMPKMEGRVMIMILVQR